MQYQKHGFGVMVLVLLTTLVAGGCGAGGRESSGGPVEVVATFSILGDLVKNVGGDKVELTTFVGPNSDTHTFEPSPEDSVRLADAAVLFETGLKFEPWVDDLYGSAGSEAERVVVTGDIDPLTATIGEEKGEPDPHVWYDVQNATTMVESVRDALVKVDPDNAETYKRNADGYMAELEELDAGVREQVDSIPEENRKLFTSHDTFGYFAERYGFEVDAALASVSTEASDPSAGETAELIEEIEASGVPAIFVENVGNPDSMRRVASEAGVDLAPALYTDALGEPDSEGGTYVKMMRYNALTITGALSE